MVALPLTGGSRWVRLADLWSWVLDTNLNLEPGLIQPKLLTPDL